METNERSNKIELLKTFIAINGDNPDAVASVDVSVGAPIGANGFRRGNWVATCFDGTKFRFYASVWHEQSLAEQRAQLLTEAQRCLSAGSVEAI